MLRIYFQKYPALSHFGLPSLCHQSGQTGFALSKCRHMNRYGNHIGVSHIRMYYCNYWERTYSHGDENKYVWINRLCLFWGWKIKTMICLLFDVIFWWVSKTFDNTSSFSPEIICNCQCYHNAPSLLQRQIRAHCISSTCFDYICDIFVMPDGTSWWFISSLQIQPQNIFDIAYH